MIKFLFLGRRAAGRTRAAALAHLRDIHGRMVVCSPDDAGAMPSYYAQNHVIDGAYPAGDGAHAIERDLVTHLEFDSLDAMSEAIATPYYREKLRPDEPRFVDETTVAKLAVVPKFVITGQRTQHKLFMFVSRAKDVDDLGWQGVREGLAEGMAGWPAISALIDNAVMLPPNGARFVDNVMEAWLDNGEAALAAASLATAMLANVAINRATSLVIVADEFSQDRLRSLFRLTESGPHLDAPMNTDMKTTDGIE